MTYRLHTELIFEKKNTPYLMWNCVCGNAMYERKDTSIDSLQGKERVCRTCGTGWVIGVNDEHRLKAVEM